MTDSVRLRNVIYESGLKYRFIAKVLHISPYGLSRKIDNVSSFRAPEIDALCDLLHLSKNERNEIFFAKKCDLKSTSSSKEASECKNS